MRNVIFITCGLLLAFVTQGFCQESLPQQKDTLVIKLSGSNQVQFLVPYLIDLHTYQRADSLKESFIADMQKALASNAIPAETHIVHYFIAPSGKRRLKAAADTLAENSFNIEEEKRRMIEDIPSYHYIVYDLKENVEMHFYLESPEALSTLKEVSLTKALGTVSKHTLNWHNNYFTKLDGDSLKPIKAHNQRQIEFRVAGYVGASLFANQFSPLFIGDWEFTYKNKYNKEGISVGYRVQNYDLLTIKDGNLNDIWLGDFHTVFFIFPISEFNRQSVKFGLSVGWRGNPLGIKRDGPSLLPYSSRKFGLLGSYGKIYYSLDIISPRYKADVSYPMLSVYVPIF